MKNKFEHKESKGLPGGPNEYITHVSNLFSTEGYKRNSPDVNNPYNIIPSGSITMKDVDFPVYGRDNLGNEQIMMPGSGNHQFPGDSVLEIPLAKRGGGLLNKTMACNSCGWEWKAADGGNDIDTCHKCGRKALPKAQAGTEKEEKSVWGFVKEMAKIPGANISNLLGVMGIPANLIAEATESITGRGDGEFNFMDAMPSFATPGSDDEIFTFTNQNDTSVKNVAGLEDAEGNPLVENPVGAFITNLATDPSTYVGAGVAKNIVQKTTKAIPSIVKGLKGTKNIAKEVVENTVKVADNVKPSWSGGVTNYGRSPQGIQDALSAMKAQGKRLDEIGFNVDDVIAPNVINHGNKYGRQIAEVALPNGQSQLFYKSSGLAGKRGAGKTGTTEGLWQPYGGHASTGATDNWFIKDAGYENFYNSNSFKGIANKLDEIESGWDMSKQVLKSKLKYGGIPKAQTGGPSWDPEVGVDLGTIKESVKGRGQRIADIASSMEANEVDGGRPPASFDSIESIGGLKRYMQDAFNSGLDENGLCRDNTCVQTVKDFYSAAGIEAMPKNVFNNRDFLKNFKNYGFEEILDQKNLQPGDVLQYYYGPDSEGVKEDPSYLNFPYHMGVYVNPGEYIGDGDSEAPIQRKNMYKGTKDGKEYKKDPFRAFRYVKQNKEGGGISKAQTGNGEYTAPNRIDRSPPMPKTGASKNPNVLDFSALSDYLVDTRGGTADTWGQLADTIAYHESSPWSRMDPKAKQYQGGPGRGLFQFEGESFDTALKRYKNVADAKGYTIKDSIVNAKSADELSSEDQYALFLANLIESKTKLSDFVNGNISSLDVWLTGHKNVEADGDRDSFLESKKAAEKEGIKNGYKSFQYGNGEWRATAQDNTRITPRRVIPNLGKPEFDQTSKLQEFLKQTGTDYVKNQMLDTTVVRDNTAISNKEIPFIKDGNLDAPLSTEDYNNLLFDLDKEVRLEKSKYEKPNLVSDFTKSSNDYARGWKDMTNASPSEVEILQKDLLSKGYDIGATGADGDYGAKTFAAHKSMIDDVNLAPSAISKYYKNYTPDNKKEVLKIQQDLVDKGFMSATLLNKEGTSIDGKFGQQTKEALQAYNTKKTEEDPNALVFDFIPSKVEDERCAAGMCSILEGNNVMTESLGVKYKNAWDIFENMNDVENSKSVFNIYDDKAFDNATSAEDIKRITKEVKRKKQTKATDYKTGDIVGLYWDGSSHHEETLNSKTHNTHTGFVSEIIDGVPIITHNVNGTVLQQPYDQLVTGWIRRPNDNIRVNSTYNVDGIENTEIDPSAITNLSLRYESGDYEGERLTQLENVFKRAKYNSTKIPQILNSSVDPKWLESTIVGITGAETGVGASVPRSKEEAGVIKNIMYDYKGYKPKDVSLGIGKTKLTALDNFAKSYFQINSADDLGKSDDKAIDAITYLITKNYETFKDYSNTYPELNLAEEDIRNMSILAYNQGTNRLLKTGRVADSRDAETEVEALRKLYDATLLDINSTNYKHLPVIGNAAFKVGQMLPQGMTGSVRPSDSYIKKVNQYRADLFPENYAYVETPANNFEQSTMAHGGEPKSKVNELTMYKNYMNGMYDNTNMQKQAQKVYDKLNRVYLRKARLGGTTSPNYIMSKIIRETA